MKLTNEQKAMKILFKDMLNQYNSRNLSKLVGISHPGMFKILKNLEKENILKSIKIGNTRVYSIDYTNPISIRMLETILTIEANEYKRWLEEFKSLGPFIDFAILFGSILKDENTARDIDLHIVSDKKNYIEINRLIGERNKLSNKKVHLIFQTPIEFKKDLTDNNKVIIEIIKKGIVLLGQSQFIKLISNNNESNI